MRSPSLGLLPWALLAIFGMPCHEASAQTLSAKDRHVVVLGLDSNNVYVALAEPGLGLTEAIRGDWSIHAAPRTGGELTRQNLKPKRAPEWEGLGKIQHVSMHASGSKALISAQRLGGDFDLFLSHRLTTKSPKVAESWTTPVPLDGLNSEADEVFPQWEGQNLTFSSNRKGHFGLHRASAALQFLRSSEVQDIPQLDQDVLSAASVGPGFTWVSQRHSSNDFVVVERIEWPKVVAPVPEGWSICLLLDGVAASDESLIVRSVDARNVMRVIDMNLVGCASLSGLPGDRSWSIEWDRQITQGVQEPKEVVAEIRAPNGTLVRRYRLDASTGWAFVLLPLDPVGELASVSMEDESDWPLASLAVLSFDHGQRRPTEASWLAFLDWAKSINANSMKGKWTVVGHTDKTGTPEVNDVLSLRRAQGVAEYLTETMQWPKTSLEVRGVGSAQPIGENPAQNRRVEVHWVPAMQ